MSAEPSPTAGFTLIEVLVALAVVGFAMAAIAGVFSNGLLGHEVAADADRALAVAEERLTLAGAAATLRPGTSNGRFAERFDWQMTIALFEDDATDKAPLPAATLRLYRIAVEVAWRDGHRGRRLALSTLRLGPPPP
jgi:general secretion pathway protein I